MLNIALPKGRLGDKVYGLFSSIGYDCAPFTRTTGSWCLKTRSAACGTCW